MCNPPRFLQLLVGLVIVFGLACGPCGSLAGTMPTPPHDIILSTDSAERLESRLRQSLQGAPGQRFILSMTDSEVTSLVRSKLAAYGKASPVQNLIIWFSGGRIYGTGRLVHVLPVESDFFLTGTAAAKNGRLSIEMEQITTGSLNIPESVLSMLSRSVSETIDELQLDVTITGLEILEGEAIVYGTCH